MLTCVRCGQQFELDELVEEFLNQDRMLFIGEVNPYDEDDDGCGWYVPLCKNCVDALNVFIFGKEENNAEN